MALTQEQINNIRSKAGAGPLSTATTLQVSLIEKIKPKKEPTILSKVGKFATNALPAIGGTIGGIGGGILGAVGGPAGIVAGSVAGATAGGSLGEFEKQQIEKMKGERESLSGKDIALQGAGMGAMEAVGGPIIAGAGKVIKGVGGKIVESVIPTSAVEAKLLQTYKAGKGFFERAFDGLAGKSTSPQTAGKTVLEKGLAGTESMLGVQAKKASTNLWDNLISPQLDKSKVKVNLPAFFKEAEQTIIKNNPEKSTQNSLLEALDSFKEDYSKMGEATMKQLQEFKEGWAKFIPEKAYKGKPIAGAANSVKDTLAEVARTKIYNALGPEVKQAYFDYGNLKGIQELGQKAMTGSGLKGGFGGFWSTIKDMAITPIGTIGGQVIYKAGKGVELFGKPGARIVRDLFIPSSTPEKPNELPQ